MRLRTDCTSQLQTVFDKINNETVRQNYSEIIEKCFSYLYVINYLTGRVELKRFFSNISFNVSYSCLIESFILLLENYPRGSALVLRSALENFVKSIIEVSGEGRYSINDRAYSENRKTINTLIEQEYPPKYHELFKKTNDQMQNIYGHLSGLSHSLTPESQNNLLGYFSDASVINQANLNAVFGKFLNVLDCIFICSLLLSRGSLELWERDSLEEVLSIVFGKKRTTNLLMLFT
jgi:hypothetical protein